MRISDWSSDVCSSDLIEALVGFVTAEDVDLLVAVKQRIEDRGIALPPIDDRERVVVRWTLAHDDRARKRHDELAHLPIRAFKLRLLDHVPGVVFRAWCHCRKLRVGIRTYRRRTPPPPSPHPPRPFHD